MISDNEIFVSGYSDKSYSSKIRTFISTYSIILTMVPSLFVAFFPGKIVGITMICSYPLIIGLYIYYRRFNNFNVNAKTLIKVFIFYGFIMLLRGVIDAESIQDFNTLFFSGLIVPVFLPLCIKLGSDLYSIRTVVKSFLIYGIIICFILYLFPLNSGPFGFNSNFSPILILLLLIPYLKFSLRTFILIFVIINFLYDFTNRSNLLDTLVASIILLSFIFKDKNLTLRVLKLTRLILLLSPIILIYLGVFGKFNVFQIGKLLPEYSLNETKKGINQDVFVDSRTSIYNDVLNELEEQNAYLFGLGLSGKTKTSLSDDKNSDYDKVYKEGRRETESGMLNFIQRGGAIGAILYFLLFFKSSYYAIYKSNNWFLKMLGIWLSYKLLFSFIEDPLSFSIDSLFLFFSIGICFNKKMRSLSDYQIAQLFNFKLF